MKVVDILLVEDDQLDVMDVTRSLEKLNILFNLAVVTNGEEAIEWLNRRDDTGQTMPDVILIDINMPKMNGLELLHVIRANEQWKNFKCFILTTSSDSTDQSMAKKMGISGYIIKPLKLNSPSSIDAFNLMIDMINFREEK